MLTYRAKIFKVSSNFLIKFLREFIFDFLCFAGTEFCDFKDWFFLLCINFCDFREVAFNCFNCAVLRSFLRWFVFFSEGTKRNPVCLNLWNLG